MSFTSRFAGPIVALIVATTLGVALYGVGWALSTYAGALVGVAIVLPFLIFGRRP